MMNRITTYILSACFILACTISCTKENPDSPQNSGDAIRFVTSTQETTTKAEIIDGQEDFINKGKGENEDGGFSLDAWFVESSQSTNAIKYISDAWVWYFEDAIKENLGANRVWRFREKTANKQLTEYYWPNNGALNFFAYMPMTDELESNGITIENYTVGTGPVFTVTLPLANDDKTGNADNTQTPGQAWTEDKNATATNATLTQDNICEFIYAYTPGATSTEKRADAGDGTYGVDLKFVHPYSAIYVKLENSHRMTIHTIKFTDIFYKGTYTHYVANNTTIPSISNWSQTGSGDLLLHIGKAVPDDINYGVTFNGPNLVLPQQISDKARIEVNFTTPGTTQTTETRSALLKNSAVSEWKPGYAYTYSLNMGDNQEEVLFNVLVDKWKDVAYKNEIGVE